MGGDGGTISSNRTYLRGAGKACHTADHPSNALKRAKLEDAERARLTLGTCAASGAALDLSPAKKGGGSDCVSAADIAACPYGKLYRREKALEALLHRSQTGGGDGGGKDDSLGLHIRGMKDLHPVRFHVTKSSSSQGGSSNGNGAGHQQGYVAACPITGSEIGSGNVPCFVIVRTKSKEKKTKAGEEVDEVALNPNVLSERAIKEMGVQGLQAEYGPFEEKDMIRLAPPKTGGVFEDIQRQWLERMEEERLAKLKKKKKDKKRKRGGGGGAGEDDVKGPPRAPAAPRPSEIRTVKGNNGSGKGRDNRPSGKKSVVDEARSTVQSAVAKNPVLSNLFGTGKKKPMSEKEKKIHLFTRNC